MPFPQREKFKKEIYFQCETGTLRKLLPAEADQAEWRFPVVGIPKNGCSSSDRLSEIKRLVKRIPCFVEPIHGSITSVGHWTRGSAVDLNM